MGLDQGFEFEALSSRFTQTEGNSDSVSSTRSVGVTLARRFNAGERVVSCSRRVATTDFRILKRVFQPSRREYLVDPTRR